MVATVAEGVAAGVVVPDGCSPGTVLKRLPSGLLPVAAGGHPGRSSQRALGRRLVGRQLTMGERVRERCHASRIGRDHRRVTQRDNPLL